MKKPIVLVIMDGVGRGDGGPGDAVALAKTPNLDHLFATCPFTWLKAHGTAVGLPSDDDMGNSEVGHNALGCGQVYSQGAKLVQESIDNGTLFRSQAWVDLTMNCTQKKKTMHFIGLLSDGNVHSNISHLIALLRHAKEDGVRKVRVHTLLDGRDVPATSALEYIDQLEAVLAELSDETCDYRIASGGGRMKITMDRYQANWGRPTFSAREDSLRQRVKPLRRIGRKPAVLTRIFLRLSSRKTISPLDRSKTAIL